MSTTSSRPWIWNYTIEASTVGANRLGRGDSRQRQKTHDSQIDCDARAFIDFYSSAGSVAAGWRLVGAMSRMICASLLFLGAVTLLSFHVQIQSDVSGCGFPMWKSGRNGEMRVACSKLTTSSGCCAHLAIGFGVFGAMASPAALHAPKAVFRKQARVCDNGWALGQGGSGVAFQAPATCRC